MEDSNPELESFRQQWRAEVSAKAEAGRRKAPASRNIPSSPRYPVAHSSSSDRPNDTETTSTQTSESPGQDLGETSKTGSREPRSALEHYEKAVESENQGKLADSVNLYRKAFRVSLWSQFNIRIHTNDESCE